MNGSESSGAKDIEWCILTTRYGRDVRSPRDGDLAMAIEELLGESRAVDGEHADSWIRCGFNNGMMLVVSITESGAAQLETWADQNFDRSVKLEKWSARLDAARALAVFRHFVAGEFERVREGMEADV